MVMADHGLRIMRLQNKTAIVTGAARGIGKAIAQGFAQAGASVIVADILREQAEQTAAGICAAGGSAIAVTVDLADLATHETLVNTALNQFGRLDILVNNAAIEPRAPALDITPEVFDQTLNINLRAVFFLSQRVARAMIEQQRGGRIINLASTHQTVPLRNASTYNISKGGLMMLTKSLALELAEYDISVNGLAPGAILTDLNRHVLEDETARARVTAMIPQRRIGTPDDIVGSAIFLASDDAAYITGTTLFVDGGLLLQ
jgi:glucose 1-dehydrogenase